MIGETYRFKIGDFECLVICDSDSMRAISTLLVTAPPAELEAALREGGYQDESKSSMNILVVRAPQETILVDTGVSSTQTLPQNLKANGIDPADINRVMITHGHGDHLGGIAYQDGELTYPNARYSMSKTDWDFFWDKAQKTKDPDLVARRSLSAIQGRVDLIDHESEIIPGICAIPTPGHTPGHIAPLIESGGQSLYHAVDAIRHPVQMDHPEWSLSFDNNKKLAAQTRAQMVKRIADEKLLMLAYHYPFPGLGHIVREGSAYRWQPVEFPAK